LQLASLVTGLLVVAAIALPWFLWVNADTNGEFFRVFFWHHNVARFTGSSQLLSSHPGWYYLPRFAIDFLPWTPALVALVIFAGRSGQWRRDGAFRFAIVVCLTMFAVLSAAKFKRADYLLPAYPFAAMALGCAAEGWLASRTNPRTVRGVQWAFRGTLASVAVGWMVMILVIEPRQEAEEEQRHFAEMIREHAPAPNCILQFRMESHLLSYHLGRPLHTLVEWGELNERLAAPGPHFVVMPPEYVYPAKEIVTSRELVEIEPLEHYTRGEPAKPMVFLRTREPH
jgi:hypothetical protein